VIDLIKDTVAVCQSDGGGERTYWLPIAPAQRAILRDARRFWKLQPRVRSLVCLVDDLSPPVSPDSALGILCGLTNFADKSFGDSNKLALPQRAQRRREDERKPALSGH
jgi:hypothetical protein